MANPYCNPNSDSYPKWSFYDALMWGMGFEGMHGGRPRLEAYKDAWIVYNKQRIIDAAKANAIPVDLLACVAYNEVGGDPPFVKRNIVLPIRQFDYSGPDWMRKYLTLTKPPTYTSEGAIKIQLRVAAEVLGIDPASLRYAQQNALTECLETDVFNLGTVAKLLHDLIMHDDPNADTRTLSDEQFILAGSRYNRGTERARADFIKSLSDPPGSSSRTYTEYGRAMMRHRAHVQQLLGLVP